MVQGICPSCKEHKKLTRHHILDRPTCLKIAQAIQQRYKLNSIFPVKDLAKFLHHIGGTVILCERCHKVYHKVLKIQGEKIEGITIMRKGRVHIPLRPLVLVQTSEGPVQMTRFKLKRFQKWNKRKNGKIKTKIELYSPLEKLV